MEHKQLQLSIGGAPPPSETAILKQYNGTSWTEVNDINSARKIILWFMGTSYTAGLIFGGYTSRHTDEL